MTTALKYEAPATGAAAYDPEEWALRVELAACYRVFAYLGRYPGLAALTLFCATAGTLTVIVFPRVTGKIIDDVVVNHQPEKLWPLVLLGLGAFVAQHFFNGLRILVNNEKITDDAAKELAKNVAKRIESELKYPGRIKVTIIREMRVIEYAR